MSGTGIKGGVVLPKVQPLTCDLWWSKAPKWQNGTEPLLGPRRYSFTVTLSHYGPKRLLVDRVETPEPLPTMNRDEWTLLCKSLQTKLERLTGFFIGVITKDLFMDMKDGMVA